MGATQSIRIAAPREHVYRVITDFGRYPEFLPEIKGVTIDEETKAEVTVTFSAQIFVPLHYTLRFRLAPPELMEWGWVKGQVMRDNSGSWRLKATRDGGTEATYTVDIRFGPLVPGMVSETLAMSTLPSTLKRFKKRAELLLPDPKNGTHGDAKKRTQRTAR
ncbi:MAG: SRPBCC family protein [Deltaproteobacteria bacterium]|nr:SRPBCC family protein [Deltaproteobacteria bacterium]